MQAQIRPMVGATMSILPSPTAGALAVTALDQDVAGQTHRPGAWCRTAAGTFDPSIDDQWVLIGPARFARRPLRLPTQASLLTFTSARWQPAQHAAWAVGLAVQRLRTADARRRQHAAAGQRRSEALYDGAIVELDNGTSKEIAHGRGGPPATW